MAGGTITRKDLITDEGLEFGKEYAKNIEIAIEANKELIESAKALNVIAGQYQKVANTQQLTALKQQETLEATKAMNAFKLETEAIKAAEKAKQESLRTRKLELDAMAKEEAAKKRNTKLTIEERVELEANNRALKQAAREKLGLVSAYDKLNAKRTEAKNKLRDLIATENASTEAIKKAQSEFDKLDKKVQKADDAVRDFTKNVGNYPKLNAFAGGLKNLVGAFGLVGGVAAIASVVKGSITIVREFEQSIADLRAITGASGEDLDFLKRNAIEMGKGVKGGAKAVVESYKLIASAKPELLENVKALNQVTKAVITLSQASGMELPEAATALTDAMNQFGAPAEEAAFFIDALANGAKYGSAEIPQITEALLKFGAVAKSSNISIGESTALIELLAEKGLKGAEAGTALRNVLLKLSAPDALPRDAQKIIQGLGIDFEFLKDKTVTVQQKFEALKPLLQDDAYLVKVFGQENVVAAKNVIGHTDRLGELTSKMDEFGTAQEQAALRTQTLEGDITKLGSAWDSFILSLDKGDSVISRSLSNLIGLLNKAIEGYAFLLESDKQQAVRLQDKTYADNLLATNNAIFESYNQTEKELKKINDLILQQQSIIAKNPNNSNAKNELENLKVQKDVLKQLLENEKASISSTAASALPDLEKRVETINSEIKALETKNIALKKITDSESYATAKYIKANKELKSNEERVNSLTITLGYAKSDVDAYRSAYEKLNPVINKNSSETDKNTDLLKRNEDAQKAAEKARKDQLARLKKLDDDAFALAKFRMEQEIDISNEITENEKESIQDRIDAYLNGQQVEQSLLEETAAYKLRQISQYNDDVRDLTNDEIQSLIDGGQIKKKLTDDEILVLEQLKAQKEDLDKKDLANRQKIVDSIVEIENKKIASLLKLKDTELNNKLIKENEYFSEELKALQGNQQAIEDATKDHEARVQKIKEDSAKQALQTQIDAQRKLLENSKLSAVVRAEIENKLSKLELELNQIGVDSALKSNEEKLKAEQEYSERIKDIANQLKDAIIDLTNSIFDAKIQSIDNEIARNEEYYSRQLELAGNDQAQKDLIQQEAEKKRRKLEEEKRKEQQKQAIFNKVMQAAQVSISTIGAVMSALRDVPKFDFGISASALAATYATIGAAQLAAVLATPIPKYEKGTKGKPHKGGPALVGEKRAEVIQEPGMNPYVIDKPTILNLKKGTEVTPSIDEWNRLQRASIMASLGLDFEKAKSFETQSNPFYDMQQLEDKIENGIEKGFRKARITINNNQQGFDLEHELWKLLNIKWN